MRPTAAEQQEQLIVDERTRLERATWTTERAVDAALERDWRAEVGPCESLVEALMEHQQALQDLQCHVLTHGREVENDLYAERRMEEIRRDPVAAGFLRVRQAV
jgi:hypothetical protein